MRTLLSRRSLFGSLGMVLLVAGELMAHPPPPPKASSTQALYGTNNTAFMTPLTVAEILGTAGSTTVISNTFNNITVTTNAYFNQNVNVKGNLTVVSNVFFNTTSYSTNSAASETTIDLLKSYRAFATNNNTAFSALANIEAARTNIQTVNIFITNSSAAAKTITMSAAFQNMNASEGNTLYVTNLGHLLVFYYPGLGTNFYFKSR